MYFSSLLINFICSLYFLLAKIDEILEIRIFPVCLNYFVREGFFQEGLQCMRKYKTDDCYTHLQEEEHQKTQRVLTKKIIQSVNHVSLDRYEGTFCAQNTNEFKKACIFAESSDTSCKTNDEDYPASYQHHQRDIQDHIVDVLHSDRSSRLPFVHERVETYAD